MLTIKTLSLSLIVLTLTGASAQAKTVKVSKTINVSGKTFDGSGDTYVWTGSGNCGDSEGMPPMFNLGNGAKLKNIIIRGAPDGVHITGSDVVIDGMVNEDVCEDGISFRNAKSKNIVVQNSKLNHCSDKGVSTVRGSNIRFLNNEFRDCARAIRIKGEAKSVKIEGNQFFSVDSGIMVEKATISIKNNFAQDSDHLLYAFDGATVIDEGGNKGTRVKSLYRVDGGAKIKKP